MNRGRRARSAGICPGCGGGIAKDQPVHSWRESLTDAHPWCVIKDNELGGEQELADVVDINSHRDPPGLFHFDAEHDNADSPWSGIKFGERYDDEETFGTIGKVSGW